MVPKKSQFSPKVPNFAFVELFWGRSQIPNPVLERLQMLWATRVWSCSVNQVGDVMHAVFSQYKAAWLPQFERLLPKVTYRQNEIRPRSIWMAGWEHNVRQLLGMNGLSQVSQLLEPARPWSDLQWGLCIFDDLVEYTGPECQKYEGIFLARLYTNPFHCTSLLKFDLPGCLPVCLALNLRCGKQLLMVVVSLVSLVDPVLLRQLLKPFLSFVKWSSLQTVEQWRTSTPRKMQSAPSPKSSSLMALQSISTRYSAFPKLSHLYVILR